MKEEVKTHILRRAKMVLDLYNADSKTVEYEFGNKQNVYSKEDTIILFNDLKPSLVRAKIKDIKVVNADALEELTLEEVQSIGARNLKELQNFRNSRYKGSSKEDTMLFLEEIEIIDKKEMLNLYPQLKADFGRG